uniref:Uncharacterized protein LOC105637874 isoform X2 n=1 Tax=Rhizophora mucronata TaxID=61149 RepID=A0A2P2QSI8_RHIMU
MEPPKPQPQSEYPSPSSPLSSSSSKESLTKRYKPIWRILLISNLALGAYMFAQARKKNVQLEHRKVEKKGTEGKASVEDPSENITTNPIPEALLSPQAVSKPKEPIPEDQQRELFKWILEEKRKLKLKDPEEKKRIDEEKAILKRYIRAKSFPSI